MYSEEPYKMLVEGEEYISFGRNIRRGILGEVTTKLWGRGGAEETHSHLAPLHLLLTNSDPVDLQTKVPEHLKY